LNGATKDIWNRSLSNEYGRLAQGNDYGIKGTNTISFIPVSDVPADRDVTYGSFVCDHRPLKDEEWRVRLVVGGDKLAYPDDPASPAANLLDTKLIINSTISDSNKGARFMTVDLKNFFIGSAVPRPE